MLLNHAYQLFRMEKETYCTPKTLEYYDFNVTRFINFCADAHGTDPAELQSDLLTHEDILRYVLALR